MRQVAAVRRFVDQGDSVLALIGPRGTGKTQVLAVAVAESIDAGRSARYATTLAVLSDLKRRYNRAGGAETDWLAEWGEPHLLCLDEVAERLDTPHAAVMLAALVDARYSLCRPTILAGNAAPARIIECLGDSIASRCNEGGGVIVFGGWPSFRG